MALELRNSFATVVHDAPPGQLDLRNSFATVVHDGSPAGQLDLRNSFATVVHDGSPAGQLDLRNLFITVVHNDIPVPPPSTVLTASNPTVKLVEANSTGYVFNTYRVQNLSVQRSRESEQVPFKLGTKGKLSLRVRTNQEFTGSA